MSGIESLFADMSFAHLSGCVMNRSPCKRNSLFLSFFNQPTSLSLMLLAMANPYKKILS